MASDLDPVAELLSGKWFWPILVQLGELEDSLIEVLPLLEPALRDDAPDWSFNCVLDVARTDSSANGFCDPRAMDSRDFGRMVGAKVTLCERMAASHALWAAFTPEQALEFDAIFGEDGVHAECKAIAFRFVEEFVPRMWGIKRGAMCMAMDRGGLAEVDYLQGYVQGTDVMSRILERLKTKNKRQQELKVRHFVFFFAVVYGEEIERSKSESNWPELHRRFEEAFDYKIEVSEDAFKKILSRKGLKGVGRAGRPPRESQDAVLVNRDTAA